MSFLQRIAEQESPKTQTEFFDLFTGKPFWLWDKKEHLKEYDNTGGLCCFNHILGCPDKSGTRLPLFDYEKIVIDALEEVTPRGKDDRKDKHVWVKKATGLGISELMLRYMAYLCLRDGMLRGSQMVILTGPRVDLAIGLIKRLKSMFVTSPTLAKFHDPILMDFEEKALDELELNGVIIEAFPSHLGLDSARGLPDVSFVFLDEADFFPKGKQQDARDISERYIGKSDPYIVMVSTPNAPRGLFENIEREAEDKCIYKRIFLDYQYGINKIYTLEEINKAKASGSFDREYGLQYLGLIGNLFSPMKLDIAKTLGTLYDPNQLNLSTPKCISVDPGFGSSNTGVMLSELGYDDRIHVLYAEEYERPMFQDMVALVHSLYKKAGNVEQIFCDGNNPEFITALKLEMGERLDYQDELSELKKNNLDMYDWGPVVLPVNFSTEEREMTGRAKHFIDEELVAIPEKFDKLITACRTAVTYDGKLDKEATSFNDLFDCFRMNLKNYKFY